MGEEGFSSRLLAALPPRPAVGDRRCPRRGTSPSSRPDAEPPAEAPAPQAARALPGRCLARRRRRPRPPARARQRRRADLVRRGRHAIPALPQRDRRRVRLRRVRARRAVETVFGALEVGAGRLRHHPARRRPTGGSRGRRRRPARCAPTASRATATSRRPSATCQRVRPAAGARAVLRARPADPGRARCSPRTWARRTRTPTSTSSTGATGRAGWSARSTPTRSTRSTSSAGTAASIPYAFNVSRLRADHRPDAPAAAGAPGLRGLQLRRSATSCRARSTTTRCRSRCPTTTPTSTATRCMFYCGGDYEARKGSGIGQGSISLHPGGHAHGPQPGAARAQRSARSTSTSWPSWSTPSGRWSSARAGSPARTASTTSRGAVSGADKHDDCPLGQCGNTGPTGNQWFLGFVRGRSWGSRARLG